MRDAGAGALLGLARVAWVAGALGLAAAPHLLRVPTWVGPALLLLGAWRFRREAAGSGSLGRPALFGLALAALALSGLTNPRLVHQDTFVTLLVMLGGLKLLEARGDRDALVTLFLSCFLVFVHFLNTQEMAPALYGLGAALVAVAAMNAVTAPAAGPRVAARLRLALALAAQAAPLALLLFVLFPRVAGHQWSITPGATTAATGLSDRLDPGSVSRVARSDEVAFRVTFEPGSPAPPSALRYWRGPVLEEGDGLSWRQAAAERRGREATRPPPMRTNLTDHWVTLEPHGRPWLLALDVPERGPGFGTQTPGLTLVAHRPVRERIRYRVGSTTAPLPVALTAEVRERNLRPPARASARVAALARRLRAGASTDGAVVTAVLAHIRREPFAYTLEPPPLGADALDEFLFVTRRGFCEHYAAATASLLRLAGVPARVVTGYLGGEHNPLGDYWVVRQSDAHAWCEAWLTGRGWLRVDPTAAVAPERVELGLAGVGDAGGRESGQGLFGALGRALWRGWDATANGWNQWFLGYDRLRQRLLLARLGYRDAAPWGMALALAALGAAALGLLVLRLALAPGRRLDPAEAAYRRFCARLARAGLPRQPHEGPLAYAARVGRARPDLREPARRVADLYAGLRYGAGGGEALARLRFEVRGFAPRR